MSVTNEAQTPPAGTAIADILGTGLSIGGTGLTGTALLGTGASAATNYVDTKWTTNLTGSWTIGFWLNYVTPSTSLYYYFGNSDAGGFRCFSGGVAGINGIMLRGSFTNDVELTSITAGTHYIHFVHDAAANTISGYVDGVFQTSETVPVGLTVSSTSNFKVGGYGTNDGPSGPMDEFRLYSRALPVAEIVSTYNVELFNGPCTTPPTAGIVSASATSACPSETIIVSATGATSGVGATYQWQTSANGTTGWTNIAGATMTAYSFTATSGFYRLIASCSGQSDTSASVQITVNATPLSGTYTIDAGGSGNYTSIAAFITDLNCKGISSAVTANILAGSGPYNEQVTIGTIGGASATNTVTINGNGDTLMFAPTTTDRYVVRLDGAKHVIIDDLTIMSTDVTNGFGIWFTNSADSNTIRNSTIDLSSITSTSSITNAGIVSSGSPTSPATAGNNGSYNLIEDNTIVGGYYGVRFNGANGANNMGNIVRDNDIEDFYAYGVYGIYQNGMLIQDNDISRANRTAVTTFYGAFIGTGSTGSQITGNRIYNSHGNASSQTGAAYPIYHSSADGTAAAPHLVANNLIYEMNSADGVIYALYNIGSDYVNYYHNSISIDNQSAVGTDAIRGFYQTTAATNLDLKNNIISITHSGTGVKTGLYFNTAATTFTADYNNVYVNGASGTNYYGRIPSTNYNDLITWQAATSGSANSKSVDPLFVGANNLIPQNPQLNGAGTNLLTIVPTDINGAARTTTPDLGAIEFVPPSCPAPGSLSTIFNGADATLFWMENGTATNWVIEYGLAGFTQGTGTTLTSTDTFVVVPGLPAQTDYDFYVRSACSSVDSSFWAGPMPFTTPCGAIAMPYIENFEGTGWIAGTAFSNDDSEINDCWTRNPISGQIWGPHADATGSGSTGPDEDHTPGAGVNFVYMETSSGTTGSVATLESVTVLTGTATSIDIEFWYHMYGATMGTLAVDGWINNVWQPLDSITGQQQTDETDPWLKRKITVTGFGSTFKVRFRGIRGTGLTGDMAIDDFRIIESPTCPSPNTLFPIVTFADSAILGWVDAGTATNWQVEYGPVGFTLGTGTRLNVTTDSAFIGGLTPLTNYQFYVRTVCIVGDSSIWEGPKPLQLLVLSQVFRSQKTLTAPSGPQVLVLLIPMTLSAPAGHVAPIQVSSGEPAQEQPVTLLPAPLATILLAPANIYTQK